MIVGTTVKHKDRLLRMADLLERDAANDKGVKFDLTAWAQPSERAEWAQGHYCTSPDYYTSPDVVPTVDCGTTACAIGLAAISGEFKNEGLSWDMISFGSPGEPAYNLVPLYSDGNTSVSGFSAAAALFGIDVEVAEYLFDPSSYYANPQGAAGELLVASRIRDLVATETYDSNEYDDGDGDDDEGDDDDYGDDDDRPEPADNE